MAATVISFINLKGGVGKTTLAVNIGASLAEEFGRRVLVIDTDPQTNATISLISQTEWEKYDKYGQTLFWLFYDLLYGEEHFNLHEAIIKKVSEINNLDLLPSSIRLIEIQDKIPDMDISKHLISYVDVLYNQIVGVMDNYDYIIIDCPPNLGAITLNGIAMSDYYIIPSVPDILSRKGINIIRNRINDFKHKKHSCTIEPLGIIFNKVDYKANLHKSTMHELRENKEYKHLVFENELLQRIHLAEAPDTSKAFIKMPMEKRKKPAWNEIKENINSVTKELLNRLP